MRTDWSRGRKWSWSWSWSYLYNAIYRVSKELSSGDTEAGREEEQGGDFAVQLEHDVRRPDFGETHIGLHGRQNITNKLEGDPHGSLVSILFIFTKLKFVIGSV